MRAAEASAALLSRRCLLFHRARQRRTCNGGHQARRVEVWCGVRSVLHGLAARRSVQIARRQARSFLVAVVSLRLWCVLDNNAVAARYSRFGLRAVLRAHLVGESAGLRRRSRCPRTRPLLRVTLCEEHRGLCLDVEVDGGELQAAFAVPWVWPGMGIGM